MTADLINLNRARKDQARRDKAAASQENRARFGRTKAEKLRDKEEAGKTAKRLDGHRRNDPETP